MSESEEQQYYYEEEAETEDEKSSSGAFWSMDHYAHLDSTQYYAGFGVPFVLMFGYMLFMLIGLGHWTVSAAPLVIQYQFSDPRTIPFAIVFSIDFFAAIGSWSCAFMGFALNYFELPPCKTYVFFANMCNLFNLILIIGCIVYMCLLPLAWVTIRSAFTSYNWMSSWKSREELCRLPNGQMCSRSGDGMEAERMTCAKRTYDYLEVWTIVLGVVGVILGILSILAIWKPIAGGKKVSKKED